MAVLKYFFMAIFLGVGLLLLVKSQDLSFRNAAIPRAATLVILILGVIEFIKMWKHDRIESSLMHSNNSWDIIREKALMIGWLVFTFLSIYILGFIYGIFLSGLVFFRIFFFKKFLKAAFAAFVIGGFVYVAFVRLAGFALYEGWLFG